MEMEKEKAKAWKMLTNTIAKERRCVVANKKFITTVKCMAGRYFTVVARLSAWSERRKYAMELELEIEANQAWNRQNRQSSRSASLFISFSCPAI